MVWTLMKHDESSPVPKVRTAVPNDLVLSGSVWYRCEPFGHSMGETDFILFKNRKTDVVTKTHPTIFIQKSESEWPKWSIPLKRVIGKAPWNDWKNIFPYSFWLTGNNSCLDKDFRTDLSTLTNILLEESEQLVNWIVHITWQFDIGNLGPD